MNSSSPSGFYKVIYVNLPSEQATFIYKSIRVSCICYINSRCGVYAICIKTFLKPVSFLPQFTLPINNAISQYNICVSNCLISTFCVFYCHYFVVFLRNTNFFFFVHLSFILLSVWPLKLDRYNFSRFFFIPFLCVRV